MLRKLLQPFYTAWFTLTFLVCLLCAFPIFFIVGLWDKPNARKLIWIIVHHWALGWLFCVGMPVRRKGTRPDKQRYVYIANHISYLDTVLIYAAIPYYFRTLAKKEMVRIPIFGFVYKQLAILVDRSSPESRAKSMRLMWRQLRNECNIAVFPEGTFNETGAPLKEFYNGAFRLAINTQTPILPMIFPDSIRRWHFDTVWQYTPGRNRVIYLQPIPTTGLTMDDLPDLKQKVYEQMEQALINASSR